LADHLSSRREEILRAWQRVVGVDPELSVAVSLNTTEFLDHVPALLDTFLAELRKIPSREESKEFREVPALP